MQNLKQNFIYILVGIAGVFVLIALIIDLVFLKNPRQTTTNSGGIPSFTNSTTPTSYTNGPYINTNQLQPGYDSIYKNPPVQLKYDSIIGEMEKNLPYSGSNFSLNNDYKNGTLDATINKNNSQIGNQELDSYLKSQGIESRDWIKNLVIIYQ